MIYNSIADSLVLFPFFSSHVLSDYKVWTLYFIEHVWLLHSIPSHFLDRGFSSGQAQNWASVVLWPTNSTHNSTIYKLTSKPMGWLAQPYTSIPLCPPNNAPSSAIYKLTDILQGWRGQDCHCLRMVIPINYLKVSKNIISNTKLALTSDNWTHWYETVGITPSVIYKLTTRF